MTDAAETNITKLPVPERPKPPIVAGIAPRAIVPQDFDQVWRLALAIEASGLAPRDMNKAEQITVAIMHGLEIGLPPMQAIQRIAVINGRPTLWGDGVMAVVRASGKLETIREWMEGEGDNRVAICEAKRRDDPQAIRRTFSVADAKRAGLWSKKGPWQDYPERMMQMRARAFTLRDGFADVMGGFYVREEIEDELAASARDVTPAPANSDPEKVTRAAQRPGPPPAAIEHKPAVAMEPEGTRTGGPAEAALVEAVNEKMVEAKKPIETGFPQEIVQEAPKPAAAKRPGPPPSARPAAPTPAQQAVAAVQQHFPGAQHVETRPAAPLVDKAPTFEQMRDKFEDAAKRATDEDALNEAWARIVEPWKHEPTDEQFTILSDLHGFYFNRLTDGD